LVTETAQHAAKLYDLLANEPDLRFHRMEAISRQMDLSDTENAVRQAFGRAEEEVRVMEAGVVRSETDEANLRQKIEKKRQDLERREKRLKSLQGVRCVFQLFLLYESGFSVY
jgi:clusterin-associated protein 1